MRPPKAPRGLTLVEMIVTMAILSMLTVGALRVLGTILRRTPMDAPGDQTEWTVSLLGDVFAADLYHAEAFEATGEGFALQTLASLEPTSMRWRHLPSRVTYHVEPADGQRWLIRTQRPRTAGRADMTTLVCAGVRKVHLIATEPIEGAGETPWLPVAESMAVLVEFEQPRTPVHYLIRTR